MFILMLSLWVWVLCLVKDKNFTDYASRYFKVNERKYPTHDLSGNTSVCSEDLLALIPLLCQV